MGNRQISNTVTMTYYDQNDEYFDDDGIITQEFSSSDDDNYQLKPVLAPSN